MGRRNKCDSCRAVTARQICKIATEITEYQIAGRLTCMYVLSVIFVFSFVDGVREGQRRSRGGEELERRGGDAGCTLLPVNPGDKTHN